MAVLMVFVVVSTCVELSVSAASTPVSVNYGDNANFSWPLPVSARGKSVRVVSPGGQSVLDWSPDCTSSVYTNRIRASCKEASRVTFTLLGVTWSDEGAYTCRAVTSSGPQIEDCGQNLTLVTVPPKVHIELKTSDATTEEAEGKYLTLTCEVTKAEPPVPEDGYSWSYLPSSQLELRSLGGKTRTLTLGPLTTKDSGQYFCRADNDPEKRWKIPPVTVSVALNASCIDALLHSEVSPKAVVEKDRHGYGAMFELAQHPGLILVQHPNTYIITDWHSPCNFGVTDAFKNRVTNTSCDLCRRTLSFSLVNVTKEDLGWYQCYAGRVNGTKIDSCSVELISKVPIQVHMEPRTPDAVVKGTEGKNLTLTCVVTQALPPVSEDGYSWSYLPSPQGQLRPLVGNARTLSLCPLSREHNGQYFCQARNDLTNGGKIPHGNASVTVDVSYLGQIKSSSDQKVNEGDHVTLTCSVDSKPAARLAWVVEGREVRNVTANVDHYEVERAACSDSKTYVCRASNPDLPGLEHSAFMTLTVNCGQVQASNGHEWWQITIVVLVVLLVIMVAVAIGLHVYRIQRHGQDRPDRVKTESQQSKQTKVPSQESNTDAETGAGQPLESVSELAYVHWVEETHPPNDPNAAMSPSQGSSTEATTRADQSTEAVRGQADLNNGQETLTHSDLRESSGSLTRSQESISDAPPRAGNSSEANQMGTILDETEIPQLEAELELTPQSQGSNTDAKTMTEQPPEADIDNGEETDLPVDLEDSRGSLKRIPESTSDSTPRADNSSEVDQTNTTPDEEETVPLLIDRGYELTRL